MLKFDVVIVGSGLAGLTLALHLPQSCRIAIISKQSLLSGSSDYAQGGIAAVLDKDDSCEAHIQDTIIAGSYLCDNNATQHIIQHGQSAVRWLIDQEVPFTPDKKSELGFHLTREGGHSHRRIIHAADATGHRVMETLIQKIRQQPNITVLEQHIAIDIITNAPKTPLACMGVYVQDLRQNQTISIAAAYTVLATGGAGQVYLHSTNPSTSTGDGIAMAYRAGCRISNMEFMQFHPTALCNSDEQAFLISEALRGEGAQLTLPDAAGVDAGKRFMLEIDTRAELAPRDIVARAIDAAMKKYGIDHVNLTISHLPAKFTKAHFPTIYAHCLTKGIDITKAPIPVVPASHYTCGGVMTDIRGRTDIARLYAIGETACTGLHGANRLASNSLLECLVMGQSAAQDIIASGTLEIADTPEWEQNNFSANTDEDSVILANIEELRRFMSSYVGIVRTTKRLERAQHRIRLLKEEMARYYAYYAITPDLITLRNLIDVAHLIVTCALSRKESRGLHYTLDYPATLTTAKPSVVIPPKLG